MPTFLYSDFLGFPQEELDYHENETIQRLSELYRMLVKPETSTGNWSCSQTQSIYANIQL
jgi:hypothetical protein